MNWRADDEQNHLIGRVEGTGHVYILGGGRAQSVKGRSRVGSSCSPSLSLLQLRDPPPAALCLCSVLCAQCSPAVGPLAPKRRRGISERHTKVLHARLTPVGMRLHKSVHKACKICTGHMSLVIAFLDWLTPGAQPQAICTILIQPHPA